MAIEIISNSILRPSSSPPPNHEKIASLVPLTIFDRAAFNLHVNILYAFRPPMPSNEAIVEGLAKALTYFPHFAGRLTADEQGQPCIVLNGAGVRLVEANVGATLAKSLPFEPSPKLKRLHPPVEGVEELLQIQINRYTCGGLVIGQTAHHRVADGQSMSFFFSTWAMLVRGLEVDQVPYHNRGGILLPRDPPKPVFNHRSIEFKVEEEEICSATTSSSIINLVLNFSSDFVSRLKKHVNDNVMGPRYSTFVCLLTHIWKKMTLARQLGGDEMTQVRVAVNGRPRMKPAVPMEYFGNLVLWAYPRLRVKDLLDESYAFTAKAIYDEVARVDSSYFQSFIAFGEASKGKVLVESAAGNGNVLCPNLEVDSWLGFQFHELDFGGGGQCACLPSELPVEGLLLFVPSCKESGGVDVFMALSQDHVELLKQVSHSLP